METFVPVICACRITAEKHRQSRDLIDGDEFLGGLCCQQYVTLGPVPRSCARLHGVGNFAFDQRVQT